MTEKKLPPWLKKRISINKDLEETAELLEELNLNTVCQSADCPNIGECFANKTATFMIMGDVCTRNCRFCAVKNGTPQSLDREEPKRIAKAVEKLNLKHVVVTSVTRDDLKDGGACHFSRVIQEISELNEEVIIEVLTPDFELNKDAVEEVVKARPDIINHNVETVPRLYSEVRPEADYRRSLKMLEYVKELSAKIYTKSGIMVGLGEREEEVIKVMEDLRRIECDIFTIGQYLQPTKNHLDIKEYIPPEQFDKYKEIGEELGFKYVAAGPLIRSSFHADEFSEKFINK